MNLDKSCGKVTRLRIYERKPKRTEWVGDFSLLCLRIETKGIPRGMVLPKYAEAVFRSIEEAPSRRLKGFCETGYHLVDYKDKNAPKYYFSLPRFGENYVELCSEYLKPEVARRYLSQITHKILDEFPEAYFEGRELLD